MRLLLLSLLALSAHAHSLAYRTNLLALAPARGEFAVEHGRALGYVRYVDAQGAERLLPYYYPEPLFGQRRLNYGTEGALHPLLRSNQKFEELNSEQNALFRAWCEQRYNALRLEIERLRAEGKQPSANVMAQYEPLEQIIKTGAYAGVSGLSADVLRAREEHLRIWNEARLKVLQAEEEQMRLYGQQQQQPLYISEQKPGQSLSLKYAAQQPSAGIKQPTGQSVPVLTQTQPQPVQDTPEVLRAREEHLKLLGQVQQQQQQQQQLASNYGNQAQTYQSYATQSQQPALSFVQTQLPQGVQETPEVIRAREQHLRVLEQAKLQIQQQQHQQQQQKVLIKYDDGSYKASKDSYAGKEQVGLRIQPGVQVHQPAVVKSTYIQGSYQQQQSQSQPIETIQDTPEVVRAREEHLRLVNEIKLRSEDRIADENERDILQERESEREQLREIELRNDERRQNELERIREAEREKEEQLRLESERIALQQEEQRRGEKERYEEAERLKSEAMAQDKYNADEYKVGVQQQQPSQLLPQAQIEKQFIGSTYNIRPQAAGPAGPQAAQAAQSQTQPQAGFFLRIQANQPAKAIGASNAGASYIVGAQPAVGYLPATNENPFLIRYTTTQELKPQALIGAQQLKAGTYSSGATGSTTSSSSSSFGYGNTASSELDKATREHFRAHEIALEQLRLANAKQPRNPDCN